MGENGVVRAAAIEGMVDEAVGDQARLASHDPKNSRTVALSQAKNELTPFA